MLLSDLFVGGHPVTAVGDPCQSIYGWRGASIGNLLRFFEHFPCADTGLTDLPLYLLTSFRNGGRILDGANQISVTCCSADKQDAAPPTMCEVPSLKPGRAELRRRANVLAHHGSATRSNGSRTGSSRWSTGGVSGRPRLPCSAGAAVTSRPSTARSC